MLLLWRVSRFFGDDEIRCLSMNFMYICGIFIVYSENIIDVFEVADDVVFR